MLNVWVMLPGSDEWVFVSNVPNKTDMGEIVAACQVLFPTLVGIEIEPGEIDDSA